MKENIKAPRHWPLCGEFTGTGEFPAQKASYAENVSIWWRHLDSSVLDSFSAQPWWSNMCFYFLPAEFPALLTEPIWNVLADLQSWNYLTADKTLN